LVRNVIYDLLELFADFRYRRRRRGRFWRSGEAITFLLVVGTLLTLGILAATAATRSSSGDVGFSYTPNSVTREVVTQTITREGKTLRVIRRRTKAGKVVVETVSSRGITLAGRSVTLPARTIHETRTVTTTVTAIQPVTVTAIQPVTVTAIQPVTVAIVETVTETPGPP
jgi:hypothetical protein